jgi:peptidyl-prolyl cis-trans isomerase SurA
MTRLFSILAFSFLIIDPVFSEVVEVNGIAAKVNGKVITKNEVSFLLAPVYSQLVTEFPRRGPEFEKRFKEAQERILQELIDRQIILDEFEQLGASINPNVIDKEVDRQIRELYNGNEKVFREELRKSRLTMEGYRGMTREKMIVQAMRAEHFSEAAPPLPNEVRNEYNRIKSTLRDTSKDKLTFRKIFIPSSDPENPVATPETQLVLAESIAKQIKEGADFSEMAKQHSADAFASEGGLQKDVPRADLAADFAAVVFKSEEGVLIGPLLDPRGFTIVKIIDKHLGPAPPLSEVRPMIEQRVTSNKTSAQYETWIESRRKRAMIDTKL